MMAEVCTCPDVCTLERLMVGKVSPQEAESLEEHLTLCERCRACLTSLEASDPLVERLRGGDAIAAQLPQGEVLDALMRRLRETPPAPTGPADDIAGKTPSESETPTFESAPDLTDILGPPRGPGELGWLGTYRVVKILGVGGMGLVFQAEDTQLQRPVALKVVKPSLATSAAARERFRREARAAAVLQHDHIVTIYQEGEDHGVAFLAMQLLEGESLEDRLRREGPLPIAEILRIGRETAEGLAAAHVKGLIHRDIKPANIWLESSGGRVKILDFGLARAMASDVNLTQSGVIAGTPQYMAPEQADGTAIDARCDLFSLGCVLYRMATGEVPFPGATTMAILRAVELNQPRPPRELNPAVPPALAELILQLLGKKPSDRPASASAVAETLSAISTMPPGAALSPVRKPKVPRRRFTALAAASVLLVALGLMGYAFSPAIIRVFTPDGTLVVEVDDPGVKVTIEGDGGIVITGAGPQEVRLRPGSYKLRATKDGKPVRPEELITITRGDKRVVRVSLEGAATAKAVVKVAPGAFVVLNSKGVQVGKFDTLADAVFDASGGDTIEVRGNGPFACPPISLRNKALTIRAGNGFRPVIRSHDGAQSIPPLLETNALLVLEGLELQRSGQKPYEPGLVISFGESSLHASNCRFRIDPPAPEGQYIYLHSSVCVLRNCEFLTTAVSGSSAIRSLVMDNCLGIDASALCISYWYSPEQPGSSIQLTRNTLVSAHSIGFYLCRGPKALTKQQGSKQIRVDASANIFSVTSAVHFKQLPQFLADNKALAAGEAEAMLLRLLTWQDHRNVYAPGASSISWYGPSGYEAPRGPKNVADWKRFWGTPNADCLEGTIRYQGGNLLAKLMNTPELLTPEDFRLRPDSAGYRAGKDGKDLGADVDLVGPGKAYERWKKTPQYQQWLKDTGQVK